jgi:hypothetical protein
MADEAFEALWQKVNEAWDDEKRHAAILSYALSTEQLPELAGRYRALKDDEQKGPIARKRIDALVAAATQLLMATKSPPPPKSNKPLTIVTAIVSAIVLSYIAYLLLRMR